jgi:predicted nucleic acid-binding protein
LTPRPAGAAGSTPRWAPHRARGGEVLAVFDVLTGAVASSQPSASWHWNRRDLASLQRLMHDYGIGLAAYLTAATMRHRGWRSARPGTGCGGPASSGARRPR